MPQNNGSMCLEQGISVNKQWGGGPGAKVSPPSARGTDSISGWEAKAPHRKTETLKTDIKQKQYCDKFNKDFKNGP